MPQPMQYEQLRPRDTHLESLWRPGETKRPYGYFAAQAAFAMKAVELGLAETLPQAIEQYTALPRKIMGNKDSIQTGGSHWVETIKKLEALPAPEDSLALADSLFASYLSFPDSSTYHQPPLESSNGKQIGAFTHDYDPPHLAIRLHFMERVRGSQSEFRSVDQGERVQDMSNLFSLIKRTEYKPEPTIVTSGSWMYNYPSITGIMPTTFRESAAPPPYLSMLGDSLWGQFVTSDGGYHAERYNSFMEKLASAYDLETMVAACPIPVLFLQAPLQDFYTYYEIH